MLSNPKDREKLLNAVKEMSNSLLRQDAERQFQRYVCVKMKDEIGLEPKFVKQLARSYHKQNFSEVINEQEEFQTLYEEIFS
jgi:hypothetical protein